MRSNVFPSLEAIARLTAPPWEIQPWDTAKSWSYFTDFYLTLSREERSLANAYRAFRAKIGGKQVEKIRQAPGSWQYYCAGCDPRGKRPAGSVFEFALTWPQRALLRDVDIEKKAQLALEQEIVEFKRREIRLGLKLLRRAEKMLRAPLYVEKVVDDGKTIIVKPSDWAEGDIAKNAMAGSKLARLGYEMETERVTVGDWRQKLVGVGMDPEAFIKVIVGALATGNKQ